MIRNGEMTIIDVSYFTCTKDILCYDAVLKENPALLLTFIQIKKDMCTDESTSVQEREYLFPELKILLCNADNLASEDNRILLGYYSRYHTADQGIDYGGGCYEYEYLDIKSYCSPAVLDGFIKTCDRICRQKQITASPVNCMIDYKSVSPYRCMRAACLLKENIQLMEFAEKLFCALYPSTEKEFYYCTEKELEVTRNTENMIDVQLSLEIKEVKTCNGTETENQIFYTDSIPLSSPVLAAMQKFLDGKITSNTLKHTLKDECPINLNDTGVKIIMNKISLPEKFKRNRQHEFYVPTIIPDEILPQEIEDIFRFV